MVTGCISRTGRRARSLAVDLAGRSEVIARVKSLPLCTAWLPDGRLVIVSSPDGRLLRREPDGSLVTHADLGQPGWNDIVADGRGNIYVNRAASTRWRGRRSGRVSSSWLAAGGSVRQVADDIDFPNGMAVTADNSTLIVADSYRHSLVAFDIGSDGALSGRRVRADLVGHPGWHLCRRRGRRLVCRRAQPAMRARRCGRGGAADRGTGPRRLRLCPRRSRGDDAGHRGRGVAGNDRATRWRPAAARFSPSRSPCPVPGGSDGWAGSAYHGPPDGLIRAAPTVAAVRVRERPAGARAGRPGAGGSQAGPGRPAAVLRCAAAAVRLRRGQRPA